MEHSTHVSLLEQLQHSWIKQKTQTVFAQKDTEKKLKIALITETWPPEVNGVALSILQLVKRLQQRGHQFLLIRPKPQQQDIVIDFKPEKECLVHAQSIPKYRQMQFGWPQVFKIGQAMDEFKPDIVHIVTEGPLGLAALNQAKQRSLPISSGFHSSFHDFSRYFDLAFLIKPVRQYLKWFHNQTHLTCVPSLDTLKTLQDFGLSCPMHIVGRGVDLQRFNVRYRCPALRREWGAHQNTTVLMNVGRISPEKDLTLIFKSYRSLKRAQPQRDFRLVIVGDGPAYEEYKLNYPDVIFLGEQTGEFLSECYASADVFVFASQVETFGNVVLEAMASALPVLAYDSACAGEIIQDNEQGWLAPLGEPQQWQNILINLPDLATLKQMGKQAQQKVAYCGWDQPVRDFEQALLCYAK